MWRALAGAWLCRRRRDAHRALFRRLAGLIFHGLDARRGRVGAAPRFAGDKATVVVEGLDELGRVASQHNLLQVAPHGARERAKVDRLVGVDELREDVGPEPAVPAARQPRLEVRRGERLCEYGTGRDLGYPGGRARPARFEPETPVTGDEA